MNSFSFTGNLGSDCDLRYTKSGKEICTFSVPVTSGWGDHKKTTWIRCNLWGKQAESLSTYLNKGQQVGVVGELFVSEWEKDGVKNKMIEVNVKDVTLLGKPQERDDYGRDDIPTSGGAMGDDVPF